ncbi:MAG: hypothetical protein HZC44_09000 [Geobacter sp.]|nr:hypothetical protein [Geobacter sp.]
MNVRILIPLLLAIALLPLLAACGGGGAGDSTPPATTITATLDSAGLVTLTAENLANVAGMEITLYYDSQTLANPQVTQGALVSQGISESNTGTAGIVRIVAVTAQTFSGTGTIATITFTPVGSASGRILSLTANLIDVQTNPLAAQVVVVNP